jgi:hypothetical protein
MKFESESGEFPSPAGGIGEKKFSPLFESVFPNPFPFQQSLPPETTKLTFKPTSADVENFVSSELIFSDWKREDFLDAARTANSHGAQRKGQTAEYFAEHIDDISALSQSGVFGISRSDLNLYSKLIKAHESSAGGMTGEISETIDGLKKVHEEHELKQSILPQIGTGVALYGSLQGLKALTHVPEINTYGMALKASNPRTYMASLVAVAGATWLGAYYGGRKAGDVVNQFVNSEGVNKHFVDEAAPAMKRLLEK